MTQDAQSVWGTGVYQCNVARPGEQRVVYSAVYAAEIIWEALEKQRDPGINWQVLDAMDDSLAALLPLQRKVVHNRTSAGITLKNTRRVFCPVRAVTLLRAIEFRDMMQHLHDHGYQATRRVFIERAVQYARAQAFYSYYAR